MTKLHGRRPSGECRLHDQTKLPVRERKKLIAAREALGLNRPQMAAAMGRSRSFVYRVETGVIDPAMASIAVWLRVLGPHASIRLFEPHPRVRLWRELAARDLHKIFSEENNVAA
jgi:transcriptional regulator with XRE-family HTH domain